jgi:hypothetical protein
MRATAIEEYFRTGELAAAPGTGPLARASGAVLDGLLRDVGAARIADMDAAGLQLMAAWCSLTLSGAAGIGGLPVQPQPAGRELIDALPASPADRAKVAGGNAAALPRIALQEFAEQADRR